jgi:hypothetical protein
MEYLDVTDVRYELIKTTFRCLLSVDDFYGTGCFSKTNNIDAFFFITLGGVYTACEMGIYGHITKNIVQRHKS